MKFCVVLITVPNRETGEKLAEVLVGERLAACVNQVPGLRSTYWWQGKIEREAEELLLVKTRAACVERLTARVRELHPYSVPEIIALPIVSGSQPYLDWISAETSRP
jgi:periplasmic divalent cation tolerance protein